MPVAPSEFPPPFDSADVIAGLTDPEDERIEVGVAIVGGGPAGLACANKLMQLLEDEPELLEKLGEVPVAVIEKGKVAHLLSGANVDPSALERLFPDLPPAEWPPVHQEVTKDATYFLTKSKAFPLKPPPPNFRKEGTYTMSVSKLGRFLAEKAEEAGVYILTETAATQLLVEDRIVKGVRSGDRGRGKEGQELGNFGGSSCSPNGETTLADALRISCNTAFAQLGVELGDRVIREQAEAFGFGAALDVPMKVTESSFPAAPTSSPRRPSSPRARSATSPTPRWTTSTSARAPTRRSGSSG